MSFAPGTRLGPYEIIAPLGAGGMGEVYQARDTRLDRTVAIKVLSQALASDPAFRARFNREARSISALNHPHICTLYDVGETANASYLVMEHLEGETLAERLRRGPLPADEAVTLASQMADALDKAHRQGIVHRDLKPGNVFLVRAAGASGSAHCKLLDFGLAKTGVTAASGTFETRLATSPPGATTPLTARGTILGTFQYMAPEQVEGQEADARADIWAFGCVLYEMLTGRRAFDGKSQASLIASILERQPTPMAELQPMTPPALGHVVRTCLEKHPDNRFHTAHDLWLHLQWIEEGGSAAGVPAPVLVGRRRRARMLSAALVIGSVTVTAAAVWWLSSAPAAPAVVMRFPYLLPDDQRFSRSGRRLVDISPDGTKLAYVANQQIYVRRMDELDAQPVRGTKIDPVEVAFSPDGQSLAFFVPSSPGGSLTGATLKKIAVTGGPTIPLIAAGAPFGLRWQGDRIVFSLGNQIFSISENGGAPETLAAIAEGASETLAQPQLLHNGAALLATVRGASSAEAQIVVIRTSDGARRILVEGGMDGRVVPSGHLVWVRDNTLFAQPIDLDTLQLRGGAVAVIEGIANSPASGVGQFAFSDTGSLVHSNGEMLSVREMVWVTADGREEPTTAPLRDYGYTRISPDGTKIAAFVQSEERDIWVWDIARRTLSRLTSGTDIDAHPIWTPDGQSLVYLSGPTLTSPPTGEMFRRAANGTGTPAQIGKSGGVNLPQMVLPDGRQVLVRRQDEAGKLRLFLWPVVQGLQPRPIFAASVPAQHAGSLSPDGRWVLYQSAEGSTRDEIHVRPFQDPESGHWQLSSDGGIFPVWGESGRAIFFETPSSRQMMRVDVAVTREGTITFGPPTPLFDTAKYQTWWFGHRAFDISADEKRFLMLATPGDRPQNQSLTIVSNWFEELRGRAR